MLIEFNNILDLPVLTQSGDHLGKVEGAIVDIENHAIHQYAVKPGGITHLFDTKELLIHRDQVISVSKEKMIVEDSVYQASKEKKERAKKSAQLSAEPITRE